jgi:hypothetical protein
LKRTFERMETGKSKGLSKILNENILLGYTLDQIRNKVRKLHEMYLQKKKKANSTGEGSVE